MTFEVLVLTGTIVKNNAEKNDHRQQRQRDFQHGFILMKLMQIVHLIPIEVVISLYQHPLTSI